MASDPLGWWTGRFDPIADIPDPAVDNHALCRRGAPTMAVTRIVANLTGNFRTELPGVYFTRGFSSLNCHSIWVGSRF